VPPANGLEAAVAAVWQDVLGLDKISSAANFFSVGGTSLQAGLVSSRLRMATGIALPALAVFQAKTIAGMAAVAALAAPATAAALIAGGGAAGVGATASAVATSAAATTVVSATTAATTAATVAAAGTAARWLGCCGKRRARAAGPSHPTAGRALLPQFLGFSLSLLLPYLAYLCGAILVASLNVWFPANGKLAITLAMGPVVLGCVLFIMFGGIGLRRLILPALADGDTAPLWGATYIRWWVARAVLMNVEAFLPFLRGTEIQCAIYRALGAKVGARVVFDTTSIADYSLLEIGDDVVVGEGASISGVELEAVPGPGQPGRMVCRRVVIGHGCTVGPGAIVAPGARLAPGTALGPGESSADARPPPESPAPHVRTVPPPVPGSIALAGALTVTFLQALVIIPSFVFSLYMTFAALYGTDLYHNFGATLHCLFEARPHLADNKCGVWVKGVFADVACIPFVFLVSALQFLVIVIATKRCFVGRFTAANADSFSHGWGAFKMCVYRGLLHAPLLGLATGLLEGTPLMASYLRAMGATVGANAWIAGDVKFVEADMISIGEGVSVGSLVTFITRTYGDAPSSSAKARALTAKAGIIPRRRRGRDGKKEPLAASAAEVAAIEEGRGGGRPGGARVDRPHSAMVSANSAASYGLKPTLSGRSSSPSSSSASSTTASATPPAPDPVAACAPIVVGKNTDVATRCLVFPGAVMGEECILGNGTVVPTGFVLSRASVMMGNAVLRDGSDVEAADAAARARGEAVEAWPEGAALTARFRRYGVGALAACGLGGAVLLSIEAATLFGVVLTAELLLGLPIAIAAFPLAVALSLAVTVLIVTAVSRSLGTRAPGTFPFFGGSHLAWHVRGHFADAGLSAWTRLLHGSALGVWVLWALGATVGAGALIDTDATGEPHLVTIGAGAVLNGGSELQAHSIEARRLKLVATGVHPAATLGGHAYVMAGAAVESHGVLAPGAILMKGESLPGGAVWRGVPAVPDYAKGSNGL